MSTTYKFGMLYILAYGCFWICYDWTKFNQELRFLKCVFLKNGYPSGFINSCFKKVIDNVLTESLVKLTVEKCLFILPFSFVGDISSRSKNEAKSKFQIIFKSRRWLSSQFRLKESLPYELMSKVVYIYRVEDIILPITVRRRSILG